MAHRMDEQPENLLDGKQLAARLGKHPTYVMAMRKAGYQFKYRLTTTFEHAEAWLKENYTFRTTAYFHPKRKAAQQQAAAN